MQLTHPTIVETIGYAARVVAHSNMDATMPYAIQSVVILLGPVLFAASIYMILGRIIRSMQGEKHSLVSVRWLTKIFVLGDVLCFAIQGGGGGMLTQAKSQSDVNLGQNIILGGLIFQILMFGLFVVVAGVYHGRVRSKPTLAARSQSIPWERYFFILYIVSVLITIRNGFRVAEYAMGSDGYLLNNEWTLYVFDAALMAIVLAVSLLWYEKDIQPKSIPVQDLETSSQQYISLR